MNENVETTGVSTYKLLNYCLTASGLARAFVHYFGDGRSN